MLTTSRRGGLGRGDMKTGTEGITNRIKTGETGENGVKGIWRQDYSYPRREERHF